MKMTAGLRTMAKFLDASIVSLVPIHGIRWLASQKRAIQALLRDFVPLVGHLQKVALDKVGCAYKTTTASSSFLNLKVDILINSQRKSGRVVRICKADSQEAHGTGNGTVAVELVDTFVVKLERTVSQRTCEEYSRTKDELVLDLASSKAKLLEDVKEWDLFLALTQYRTVITLHFVHDLESTLTTLSLVFQSDDLTPSGVSEHIEEAYVQLGRMKTEHGQSLQEFYDKYDEATESYMGFNMENAEDGEELFQFDRQELLDCTLAYLKGRFDPLLENGVLKAMRDSFEHRLWPSPDDSRFANWGVESIEYLAKHFSGLESMSDFNLKEALHQWSRLKREMHSKAFFSLPYKKFWEHLSRHFDGVLGYSEVLKLTRSTAMIFVDSSCCERGFHEYNRTHSKERSMMKISKARSTMSVQAHGPKTIEDFNPSPIFDCWMGILTPESDGAPDNPRKRNLAAMIRKLLASAVTLHDENNGLPSIP